MLPTAGAFIVVLVKHLCCRLFNNTSCWPQLRKAHISLPSSVKMVVLKDDRMIAWGDRAWAWYWTDVEQLLCQIPDICKMPNLNKAVCCQLHAGCIPVLVILSCSQHFLHCKVPVLTLVYIIVVYLFVPNSHWFGLNSRPSIQLLAGTTLVFTWSYQGFLQCYQFLLLETASFMDTNLAFLLFWTPASCCHEYTKASASVAGGTAELFHFHSKQRKSGVCLSKKNGWHTLLCCVRAMRVVKKTVRSFLQTGIALHYRWVGSGTWRGQG